MQKLIFVMGVLLIATLLFGCTSFDNAKSYCSDRCQVPRLVGFALINSDPLYVQYVQDTNESCVYSCLKDIGGSK